MKTKYRNNPQALILQTALFSFMWDKTKRKLLCWTLKLPLSSLIWVSANHRLLLCTRWFGRWSYPHVAAQPQTPAERAVAKHVAESPTGNSFQNSRIWVLS
jgi:hypothetical protein